MNPALLSNETVWVAIHSNYLNADWWDIHMTGRIGNIRHVSPNNDESYE